MKSFRPSVAFLAALVATVLALPLSGQALDRPEIESVRDRRIEFVNYLGPHETVDTLDEIRAIGSELGRAVKGGATRAGTLSRYAVLHLVDPATPTGFDADVIVLGEGARVDHVRNLRHVIGAYLEAAYGYSRDDAYLLATFVTVYNAVYRGDMATFTERYKPVVVNELSAANAGLPIRWDEWAGRSRIVIPLSKALAAGRAGPDGLGAVDSSAVSDDAVVESLREEPDRAVEERRDLVDLKERELTEEKQDLEAEKAAIAEEEAAIAEAEEELAEEREAAGDGAEASLTRTEADKAAEAAAEAAIEERKEAVEERKAEVAEREEDVAAKEADIASDREAVASDQKEAIAAEVAAAAKPAPATVDAWRLVSPLGPLSELVRVDPATGRIVDRSGTNAINARSAAEAGGGIVAVAGTTAGTGAVRLVLIDPETLDVAREGTFPVHPDSLVWNLAGGWYVVAGAVGDWRLARFDPATLEEQGRSSESMAPYTHLEEAQGGLLAQAASGALVVLDPKTLDVTKEILK
ncbi:MAG: hypothetical protein JXA15_08710 [Spirochaetales bacterium]|nr:hypothetical protein [Spirochaetales bacterium]